MKQSKLTGWKNVFTFTLIQTLKTKSYYITLIIMLLIALLAAPILNIITSPKENKGSLDRIHTVYVQNNIGSDNLDFSSIKKDTDFSHLQIELSTLSENEIKDVVNNSDEKAIAIFLNKNETGISIQSYTTVNSIAKSGVINKLKDSFIAVIHSSSYRSHNLSDSNINLLTTATTVTVNKVDLNGGIISEEPDNISQFEYWFVYGTLFVILMTSSISSSLVASSIVTEKSSRVVEYLIINIKPFALMLGKVLAITLVSIIQIGSVLLVTFGSNKVTQIIFNQSESTFASLLPSHIFENLNIVNFLVSLVLIVLGLILYASIASVAGATVSKIEEIQEGLTLYTIVLLVSTYVALGAASSMMLTGVNGFVTFALLFPFSSPFLLPGVMLLGLAPWYIVVLSILIQIIFIMLILRVVAKIYEALLLHNGNRIKLKDLKQLIKTL